jgi:hypothetical protein
MPLVVSRCFSSSSSNIQDEEDSIPDQLKEDRALNIAEGLKGDPIIHDFTSQRTNNQFIGQLLQYQPERNEPSSSFILALQDQLGL